MEEITENNGTSEEKNEGLTPQENEATNENSQEDVSSDESQKEKPAVVMSESAETVELVPEDSDQEKGDFC